MQDFVLTEDGSHTLYSKKYNQHFHDVKTGAIQESLTKHVIPALSLYPETTKLKILDICFGLGYNTFSTIYYVLKENLNIQLEIVSPELDGDLVQSLASFEFPEEFNSIQHIIQAIAKEQYYEDENIKITVLVGDARSYIRSLENIDIVYQDAFSSDVNHELWTVEYFKDIYKACNQEVVLTTYSVSSNIRLSLYKAGFEIYEIRPVKLKQTIALKAQRDINAKYIDMELKQQRNKEAKALYDTTNY